MEYDFTGLTKADNTSASSFDFSGLTKPDSVKPSDKFLEGNPFGPKGVLPNSSMEQFYSGFMSSLTSPLSLVGSAVGLVDKGAGRDVSEFLHVKPDVSGPATGLLQKFARGTGTLAGMALPVGWAGRGVKALTGLSRLKNLAWLAKLENPLAQTAAVGAIYGSMESPDKSPGTVEDFSSRIENAGRTALTFATLGAAGMGINKMIETIPGLKTALENVSPKHAEWVKKAISEGTLGAGLGLTEPANDAQDRIINALSGGMSFPVGSALTGGFNDLGQTENLKRYFSGAKVDPILDPELSRYADWQDKNSILSSRQTQDQTLIEDSISKRAKLLREANVEEVAKPRYSADFTDSQKSFIDETIGLPVRRIQRSSVSDDMNKILASKEMTPGTEIYQAPPEKTTELLRKYVEFDPNKIDASLKNIYTNLNSDVEKRAFLGKILTVVSEGKGDATDNAKYHWMDRNLPIDELARLVRDNPIIFGQRGEKLEFWKNGKIDPFRTARDLPQNLNVTLKATGPSRELEREINGIAESKRRIDTQSLQDEIRKLKEFFQPTATTTGLSTVGTSEATPEAKLPVSGKTADEYQNDILGMLPESSRVPFVTKNGGWLRERVSAIAEGKERFNDVAKEVLDKAAEPVAPKKPVKDEAFKELVSDLRDAIENNKALPPRIASNARFDEALKELNIEGKIVEGKSGKWELALQDGRRIPVSAAYMFNARGEQVREPDVETQGFTPPIRGLGEAQKKFKIKEKSIPQLLAEQKDERLRAMRAQSMAEEGLQEITTEENKKIQEESGVNLLDEGIKTAGDFKTEKDIEEQNKIIRTNDAIDARHGLNELLMNNKIKLSPEEQNMMNKILEGDLKDEPPEGWAAFMDKLTNALEQKRIDVSNQHGSEEYGKGDRFVLHKNLTITDKDTKEQKLFKANDIITIDKVEYDPKTRESVWHIRDGERAWVTIEQLDKIADYMKGDIPGVSSAVREMNKEQIPGVARREMQNDPNPATRTFREKVSDMVSRPFAYLDNLIQWKSIDLTAAQQTAQAEESKIRNSIHEFMDRAKVTIRDSRLMIKTSSLVVVDPEKSPLDSDFNFFKWSIAKGTSKEDADFVHNFATLYPDTFKEMLYWKGLIDQTHWKHLMNNDADLNVWHEKRISGYFPFHGTPTEEELNLKWSKGFGSVDSARDWFEKKKDFKTLEEFEQELAKYNLVPEYDYANLVARRIADGYKRLAYDSFASDMRKIEDPLKDGIGLMVIPGRDGISVEDLRSKYDYIEVGKVMRQWNFVQPSGAEQEIFMNPSLAKEMMYLYKSSGATKAKWYQGIKKAQGIEKQFLLWQPFSQTLDNAMPTIIVAGFPRWWGIFSKALPKLFTSEKNPLEQVASPEVIQRMMLSGRTRDRELNYQAMDYVTEEANKYFRDKDAKNHIKEMGKWLAMEHAGTNNWVWSFVDVMGDAVWLEMSKRFEKKGYDQKTSDKLSSIITNDLMGNLPQRVWSRDTGALMGMLLFAKSYTTAQLRLITGALPMLEKFSPRMLRHEAVNPKMKADVAKVYQDVVVKQMVGMLLATNLVNLALSGHFAFENDEGHRTDVQLPWKAGNGDNLYYNMPLGRQFEQLIKLMPEFVGKALGIHHETSTFRWLVNKLDPVVKETAQQIFNYDPVANAQIRYPGATNVENIMNSMGHSIQASALPIEFKQGRFKTPGEYLLPMVAGGRVSPGKSELLVKVQEAEQKKKWENEKLKRSFEGLNPKSPEAQSLARQYYKSPSSYINWLNPKIGVMRRAVKAGVSEGD